jgi:lipase
MAVLHTHDFGDPAGEPLLAVHGITAHGRRFERLATEAWPQRHTVSVDLRGHGRSTSDGPWSIRQHVADLLETMDAVGFDSVDVVGHSYGGAIALALLEAAPERVRRLVMLDPALALSGSFASAAAMGTIADQGWASVEEATVARNAGLGDEIHPAVRIEIEEHLVQDEEGRYRFRYHRPAVITGWGEVCFPLPVAIHAVPALLLVADQADLVSPAAEAGLQALFRDALQVVHLDCGHMVYWERFEDTAAAITSFLG